MNISEFVDRFDVSHPLADALVNKMESAKSMNLLNECRLISFGMGLMMVYAGEISLDEWEGLKGSIEERFLSLKLDRRTIQ